MKLTAIVSAATALSVFMALFAPMEVQAYTNPITIKNYKMFDAKTGAYFAAKGIDYYPRPNAGELNINNHDFFTDKNAHVWSKDIAYLAATGANAVRLYAVDPSESHDMFMCALRSYGMYALIDLAASCPACAVTKDAYPTCYPADLKSRGEQIILAFAKYDNVLAFSAGNEVNNEVDDSSINAPCQKKFIKDMRKFVDKCSTKIRSIPVGVVLADRERDVNAKYYNCRTDSSDALENAEWYGLNAYQYCDNTVVDVNKATGFTKMVADFLSYKTSIPVMLTEFGCLNPSFPIVESYDAQRTWLQAGWLHTSQFREVFSGGFVFEFSTENANSKESSPYPFTKFGAQNYGLGYYTPDDCDHGSKPCNYTPMPNYQNLAKQYNATTTVGETTMTTFTPDNDRITPPACPTGFAKLADTTWAADSVTSLACPSAALSFSCPNQASSGTWTGTTQVSTTSTPSTTAPKPATPGATTVISTSTTNQENSATGTGTQCAAVAISAAVSMCMALAAPGLFG